MAERPARQPRVFVGTSGYSYREWKGKFYPKDLSASGMLGYYAGRFSAVEINSSFYKLPTPTALRSWAADVPAGFRFTMKAPQRITHIKRLKDPLPQLKEFAGVAATLKSRLGPLLFGLPPNMKKDASRLADVLAAMPAGVRPAFEFRHQSWFDDQVLSLLKDHGACLCIAEADDELKTPLEATAEFGYVRLRRESYTRPALKKWAAWVHKQGWREAYVFFKHEERATGPRFAEAFIAALAD